MCSRFFYCFVDVFTKNVGLWRQIWQFLEPEIEILWWLKYQFTLNYFKGKVWFVNDLMIKKDLIIKSAKNMKTDGKDVPFLKDANCNVGLQVGFEVWSLNRDLDMFRLLVYACILALRLRFHNILQYLGYRHLSQFDWCSMEYISLSFFNFFLIFLSVQYWDQVINLFFFFFFFKFDVKAIIISYEEKKITSKRPINEKHKQAKKELTRQTNKNPTKQLRPKDRKNTKLRNPLLLPLPEQCISMCTNTHPSPNI